MASKPPVFVSPYPRETPQQPAGTPCPRCGDRFAKKVKFTWWGGVVGPGLLKLVKCPSCGGQFNEKTGKSALTAIIVYVVTVNLVVLGLLLWFVRTAL